MSSTQAASHHAALRRRSQQLGACYPMSWLWHGLFGKESCYQCVRSRCGEALEPGAWNLAVSIARRGKRVYQLCLVGVYGNTYGILRSHAYSLVDKLPDAPREDEISNHISSYLEHPARIYRLNGVLSRRSDELSNAAIFYPWRAPPPPAPP